MTNRLQGKYYTSQDMARNMAKTGLGLCPLLRPILVIDMACGDGELLYQTAFEQLENGMPPASIAERLVGLDIDAEAVAVARKRLSGLLGTSPRIFVGDALIGLPVGPGTIPDTITFDWLERIPELADTWTWPLFIGNPPYMGQNTATKAFGRPYMQYLQKLHPGAHGNSDICAHFLRRAAVLCGNRGTLSFVCTNTISQGNTRLTGLKPLIYEGWQIRDATTGISWPGDAVVTVSIVHLVRHPDYKPLSFDV